MSYFFRYKTLVRFNSIHAIRIQSLPNPLQRCHYLPNPPMPSSPLFQYIQNSLGFSPEMALKVFERLKGHNPRNPDAPVLFFKSHGLSQTNIQSIISKAPVLLAYAHPESRLSPKIQFLKDNNVSESTVAKLMVSYPLIFTRSLEGYLKPLLNLLVGVLGTHEFAVQLLIRTKHTYKLDNLANNVTILRNCGVQSRRISYLLMKYPRVLGAASFWFAEFVEMVKGMGFNPQTSLFMHAVLTIRGLSRQTWDAKVKVYTSLGWSAEEVALLFRKQPILMKLSEEKIRKGVDYLTKEMGWGLSYILVNPAILFLSLEKRIIPRHKLLQFLASKGFIKKDKIFANRFSQSEKVFLKRYVTRYESKVPEILKIYEGLVSGHSY